VENRNLVYELSEGITRNRRGDPAPYRREKGTMPCILHWGTPEFPLGPYGNKVETKFTGEDGNNYLCVSIFKDYGVTRDEIMRVYEILDNK
jgi:hypothetical protein